MKNKLLLLTLAFNFSLITAQETNTEEIDSLGTYQFLEEVVVSSGVIDIAKERETPIAVSQISAQEVLLKVGNQEFPEIMNKTPGVWR
jgi:hypothetical protein